jgi:hypothetical protein
LATFLSASDGAREQRDGKSKLKEFKLNSFNIFILRRGRTKRHEFAKVIMKPADLKHGLEIYDK